MRSVETVLYLVVVATLVAAFARRLQVPAPSLLVVAGIAVGLMPGVPDVRVTPDIVSLVVLPPLLYAAGEELSWRALRDVWRPVTVLASGLVAASAGVVGLVVAAVTPLTGGVAFMLGAVLASTDPVAVSALGRTLSLPARVQALVQAESLFNDATSLVLFRVAASIVVAGGAVSWSNTVGQFALLTGGGALVGTVFAAGAILIRRRIADPVTETVVALVTPYAAYVTAEALHGSGVTAVVVTSVIVGTRVGKMTTAHIRIQLHAVYGTVIFLLESVVFALIGLQLPVLVREQASADAGWWYEALAITVALIAIRILWVFPLSWIVQRRQGVRWPSWRTPAVISWAGARGVVPLAAALSIPLTTDAGTPVPGRDLVLVLATSTIVLSLVVQGFTLAPLVRRAGVVRPPEDERHEATVARLHLARASLGRLEELSELEAVPDAVIDRLRKDLEARVQRSQARIDDEEPSAATAEAYRQLRRELLAVEGAELTGLYDTGAISEETRRSIQRLLDLEDAGLGES